MVIKGRTVGARARGRRGERWGRKKRCARSGSIEHWLIREAFLPFITPPLINRGQVNSAICYFNDVSSYEINVADLDEERTLPPRRTSFNPARSIIFHFCTVAGYLAGYLAREKRTARQVYRFLKFLSFRVMGKALIICKIRWKMSAINEQNNSSVITFE